MEAKKVSIIVPVYNVEKYLPDCLESLCGQSYRNLEIICVDDESQDCSGEICDRWAGTYNRIRVIHKENGGAASARNTALDCASGELICFVDSDDVVERDYVRILTETLENSNADAAVCGFSYLKRNGMKICTGLTAPGIYSCEEYMLRFLKDWSCSLLWNKIFRREAVGDLRMAEGYRVDDEYFTYQVFLNCGTVVVTEESLYRYRLRVSSAMQDMADVKEKVMRDRIGYNIQRYAHIAEKLPALEEDYFINTLDTLVRYWHHCRNMPHAREEIRLWVKKHTSRIVRLHIPMIQKISYLKLLYLTVPALEGEPNSIQTDTEELYQ